MIKQHIRVVTKYNITPECYWHGSFKEFSWLLILLADGYPNPQRLLDLASKGTTDEIKNIADYHYQYVNVMFDFVKSHKGYVVLRPTAHMQELYPDSKDMLYVYERHIWSHNDSSRIDGEVLILHTDEIGLLSQLLKKKLGII